MLLPAPAHRLLQALWRALPLSWLSWWSKHCPTTQTAVRQRSYCAVQCCAVSWGLMPCMRQRHGCLEGSAMPAACRPCLVPAHDQAPHATCPAALLPRLQAPRPRCSSWWMWAASHLLMTKFPTALYCACRFSSSGAAAGGCGREDGRLPQGASGRGGEAGKSQAEATRERKTCCCYSAGLLLLRCR